MWYWRDRTWPKSFIGPGEARCDIGEKPLVTQNIPFTDFPLDTIDLWLCDGVLMLPSEY